jgi:hypothetical protein
MLYRRSRALSPIQTPKLRRLSLSRYEVRPPWRRVLESPVPICRPLNLVPQGCGVHYWHCAAVRLERQVDPGGFLEILWRPQASWVTNRVALIDER